MNGAELYTKAVATLPARDIDHHSSDLYLRKTPASEALISEYEYKNQVKTFRDAIERVWWYDVPFGYMPFWEGKQE